MKKNFLLFSITLGFLYLSLSSNIGGASVNGHATAVLGCDNGIGCHGTASTATMASIRLIEKATSTPVTDGKYKPATLYTVEVMGTNAAAKGWGFMLRSSSSAGTVQAGTFSTPMPSATTKLQAVSSFTVFEHMSVMPGASSFTATTDWMSPAAGAGDVVMDLSVNAVDSNGNATNDAWAKTSSTFTEAGVSVENVASQAKVKLYPNPAASTLNIEMPNAKDYNYAIYGMNGNIVLSGNLNTGNINVANLASGNYFIKLNSGNDVHATAFTKR
ncbi:MAG: T9SS type A sorting domain-containing protein [Chitinophagales bacterium]|nr:T9SS type A sorting domain-containing protein [Chitinophagaceae bacterium]MCB9064712.1 T9SS type A sorting domain-containing protein [Chitinophagales bacterium]